MPHEYKRHYSRCRRTSIILMMIVLLGGATGRCCQAWAPTAARTAPLQRSVRKYSLPYSSERFALYSSASSFTGTATDNLISVEDSLLAFHQQSQQPDENIVFVDGSFYHKGERNGRAEFEAGPRIPGARYVDMLDISTSKELYPELNPKGLWAMLPPKELFAAMMDAFEIGNSDRVIVYARRGSIFTPRTWFLFRTMGHEKVQLMQGSLEDWVDAGGPIDEDSTVVLSANDVDVTQPTTYKARDPVNVVDMKYMLDIVEKGEDAAIIVDPRGSSFAKKGHIPGAIHLPYSSLVDPDNQLKLKSPANLKKEFQKVGIDIHSDIPVVCSCGSGVSVCHIYLALEELGRKGQTLIYDGSWNEWSKNPDAPKVFPPVDGYEKK